MNFREEIASSLAAAAEIQADVAAMTTKAVALVKRLEVLTEHIKKERPDLAEALLPKMEQLRGSMATLCGQLQ